MAAYQTRLTIETRGRGLQIFTREVEKALEALDLPLGAGVAHLFIQHTSASLLIQENADPSARADLEEFIDRLAPEGEDWYRHLDEGADDTVSHMRAAVTPTALSVPVLDGRLLLGTWQGLYVWEHRRSPHRRHIVLTVTV